MAQVTNLKIAQSCKKTIVHVSTKITLCASRERHRKLIKSRVNIETKFRNVT